MRSARSIGSAGKSSRISVESQARPASPFGGQNVVFATDLSAPDIYLPFLRWVQSAGGAVTWLHVVPTVAPGDLTHLALLLQQRRWVENARLVLHQFCAPHAGSRDREIILEGAPGPQVVQYAREQSIDLIVTGTHGYLGVKHAVLGSTAEYIVRHAPCPVFVIRPTGAE